MNPRSSLRAHHFTGLNIGAKTEMDQARIEKISINEVCGNSFSDSLQ